MIGMCDCVVGAMIGERFEEVFVPSLGLVDCM